MFMLKTLTENWEQLIAFAFFFALLQSFFQDWRDGLKKLAESGEDFTQRQNAFHAAHIVHASREATERFFRENPEETFSTERGKLMLAHHRTKYGEYLKALGMIADAENGYPDAYYVQLRKLEREGGELRKLPSLPPASSPIHRILRTSQ